MVNFPGDPGVTVTPYLVAEDDGFTLIDTGLPGTHRLILARAARLGMPIRRIALTHAHRDHVGSLAALTTALPGAALIVSEPEAPLLGAAARAPGVPRVHHHPGRRDQRRRPLALPDGGPCHLEPRTGPRQRPATARPRP
jgi:glyoxylase-like metal-dependent hydrolase (beta-lactamase superfamily II)